MNEYERIKMEEDEKIKRYRRFKAKLNHLESEYLGDIIKLLNYEYKDICASKCGEKVLMDWLEEKPDIEEMLKYPELYSPLFIAFHLLVQRVKRGRE